VAFFFCLSFDGLQAQGFSSPIVLAIVIAELIVLKKIYKIYTLSKEYPKSSEQNIIAQEIVNLSADNPKWIMIITQTYSLLSIIFLVSKFFS
jgi:hypothetical protein